MFRSVDFRYFERLFNRSQIYMGNLGCTRAEKEQIHHIRESPSEIWKVWRMYLLSFYCLFSFNLSCHYLYFWVLMTIHTKLYQRLKWDFKKNTKVINEALNASLFQKYDNIQEKSEKTNDFILMNILSSHSPALSCSPSSCTCYKKIRCVFVRIGNST